MLQPAPVSTNNRGWRSTKSAKASGALGRDGALLGECMIVTGAGRGIELDSGLPQAQSQCDADRFRDELPERL